MDVMVLIRVPGSPHGQFVFIVHVVPSTYSFTDQEEQINLVRKIRGGISFILKITL
jgi:hypothetical protein